MKKKRGVQRAVPTVTRDGLEALPTKALLARLNRLRWCEDSPDRSDASAGEIASASQLIVFKCDDAWKVAYADLKEVLAAREHIVSKP